MASDEFLAVFFVGLLIASMFVVVVPIVSGTGAEMVLDETGLDSYNDSQRLTIIVNKTAIKITVPSSATVGEKVEIKGTTNLPDDTDIDI